MPNVEYKRIDDNGLLYILQLLKPIIEASGDKNVIEVIQKNGVNLSINNKTVNIPVPTDADIQALITAYGYQTASDVNNAIGAALADITGIDFQIVTQLPQTGTKGVIYLVGTTSPYDEYIWIEPAGGTAHFEEIGSTDIDLSGYVQATEMHALTNVEIDTIFGQVWPSNSGN